MDRSVLTAMTVLRDGYIGFRSRALQRSGRRLGGGWPLDYGPDAFAELALPIEPRLSSAATIAGARAIARRFLDDDPSNPRELTRRLYWLYVQADYPDELAAWSGFDDYYACILNGSMQGSRVELAVSAQLVGVDDARVVGSLDDLEAEQ